MLDTSSGGKIRENPALDTEKPHRKVLVTCQCGAEYHTKVNIESGAALKMSEMIDIECESCNRPAGYFCQWTFEVLSGEQMAQLNWWLVGEGAG